jgi:hypothetical protein
MIFKAQPMRRNQRTALFECTDAKGIVSRHAPAKHLLLSREINPTIDS